MRQFSLFWLATLGFSGLVEGLSFDMDPPCPLRLMVRDINISDLTGTWFEMKKTRHTPQEKSSFCNIYEFQPESETTARFSTQGWLMKTATMTSGTATKVAPGKFLVSYDKNVKQMRRLAWRPENTGTSFQVLEYKEGSHLVVYSCSNIHDGSQLRTTREYAFILARNSSLDATTIQSLETDLTRITNVGSLMNSWKSSYCEPN